ncbi:hypothetical protein Tco_0575091 [Tanacetum coccineum]
MTTPIATSTSDSQMHNNIMTAGSRDRPPMLAMGRYAQWQSRFMRYVDTKPNGEALKKCIPYRPFTRYSNYHKSSHMQQLNSRSFQNDNSLRRILNLSPENKAHYEAEKEAIHLILTGIGDDIYSTVDACKTAHDIFTSRDGESIESYYSKFYKMMNEMVRNQLEVATMQVNVQFLQQLQPEWSRFVTVVKQTVDLDKESYHKLFDILKQYQKRDK